MVYCCTSRPGYSDSFTSYEDWCCHEAITHRQISDIWYCYDRGPLPADYYDNLSLTDEDFESRYCDIAFFTEKEFAVHRLTRHNKSGPQSNYLRHYVQ